MGVQRRLLRDECGMVGDQWGKSRVRDHILWKVTRFSVDSAAKAASLKSWDLAFSLYHCSNDRMWGLTRAESLDTELRMFL